MAAAVAVRFAGIAKEFHVNDTLNLGFASVRWYGVIIAFGLLLAALFGGRIAYTWKINLDKMVDVLLYGTIAGIIGARAYYVIFQWSYFKDHLNEIPRIWEGGLAIYGGIIAGILAAYIVCKVEKLNFLNLLDMVGMSLLIGQGIGRWGNFVNQEAFGTITGRHWGMMSEKIMEEIARDPKTYGMEGVANIPAHIAENDLWVHPTFFYESVWCFLGFTLLYFILKKQRRFSGQLFLCYGVWYGFGRMIIEGLRTDSLYIGQTSIRVSQVLSGALCLICLVLVIALTIRYKKHPKPIEGIDYFPQMSEKEQAVWDARDAKRAAKKARRRGESAPSEPVRENKEVNAEDIAQEESHGNLD
ncbi:MAG: prolipoprotein diacylglyceryl transferase [Clostridia bacterium]|nr:prolipoprotein diacylglyceryl transferase [Clostridia bacterium]